MVHLSIVVTVLSLGFSGLSRSLAQPAATVAQLEADIVTLTSQVKNINADINALQFPTNSDSTVDGFYISFAQVRVCLSLPATSHRRTDQQLLHDDALSLKAALATDTAHVLSV